MNLNHLVVAIYARAAMDRQETGVSDLGVAASKVRNNIRHGSAIDPVTGIPTLYMPDWDALHAYEESVGADAFAAAWAAMNDTRRDNAAALSVLWGNNDYTGMVALMDNPPVDAESGNE